MKPDGQTHWLRIRKKCCKTKIDIFPTIFGVKEPTVVHNIFIQAFSQKKCYLYRSPRQSRVARGECSSERKIKQNPPRYTLSLENISTNECPSKATILVVVCAVCRHMLGCTEVHTTAFFSRKASSHLRCSMYPVQKRFLFFSKKYKCLLATR